jgi:hypothetical protein
VANNTGRTNLKLSVNKSADMKYLLAQGLFSSTGGIKSDETFNDFTYEG